ncbi:MAG: FG-GAP-like repeat-containing protein [Pseudomonadota bacterium]
MVIDLVLFWVCARFCLDGRRLVLVAGTYGSNASEYRTEIDTFTRIEAVGGTAGDPDHFVVWRKDGSVSEYGKTTDARQEAPGSSMAYTWAQNRFADSVGNHIDYIYAENGGEHYIDKIDYGVGLVDFEYESSLRPDSRDMYQVGSKFELKTRLEFIRSYDGDSAVAANELRTYTLSYAEGTHNGVSQLQDIEECNGSTCYPKTIFSWSNPGQGVGAASTFSHTNGFAGGRAADVNGDGVNELIWMSVDQDSDSFLKMSYYSGSSWTHTSFSQALRGNVPESWTVIDYNNDGRQDIMYQEGDFWKIRLGQSGIAPSFGSEFTAGNAATLPKDSLVADFQGDGLADIFYLGVGQNPMVERLLPTGNPSSPYAFGVAQQVSGMPSCTGCDAPVITSLKPIVADFNGDGIVDFLVKESHTTLCEFGCSNPPPDPIYWAVYVSASFSEGGPSFYDRSMELPGEIDEDYLRAVDINGDGLTDVAYRDTSNVWHYRLNNGDGFEAAISIGSMSDFSSERLQFLDHDRDGDADLLYPDGGDFWKARTYSASGFASAAQTTSYPAKSTSSSSASHWHTTFIDFNGDGYLETVTGDDRDHSGSNNALYTIASNAFVRDNVITEITNGFGAKTTLTYKSITDPGQTDLYNKGTGANGMDYGNGSPVFDFLAPMYVVQSLESSAPAMDNGAMDFNATSSISYEYEAYRLQSGGRGSLGFEKITSIDDQTLIETTTTYHQDFPFIGRPKTTEVRTTGGSLLSKATNTWNDENDTGPNRQPFLHIAIEDSYAANTTNNDTGAFSVGTSLLSKVTTTTTMDSTHGLYADVKTIEVKTEDHSGSGIDTFKKTTTNVYFAPDLTDWHHGRLDETTVVHHRDDVLTNDITRKSSFTYHTTTGLLTSETIEPGKSAGNTLTTTYLHDAKGNVEKVTQSGYRGPVLPGETLSGTVDRIAESNFDADGRYVVTTEDAYGRIAQTVVSRNLFGAITQAKDINSQNIYTAYGALGRQYWSGTDTGAETQSTHRMCGGAISCPTGAVYRIETTQAGGARSMVFFDVLGRTLRTSTLMFDNQSWSNVEQRYDELGRVVGTSEPFSASTAHGGSPSIWTELVYDDLGRVTKTTFPDNSTHKMTYTGFDVQMTDQKGFNRTEEKNAQGELTKVTDHLSGWVTYQYDAQGNLTQSAQGGPAADTVYTYMEYDLLGRKILMADADMAPNCNTSSGDKCWRYEYNSFGELVEQTTAENDVTRMSYDLLGRMVRRIDLINGTSEERDAFWLYDVSPNGLDCCRKKALRMAVAQR